MNLRTIGIVLYLAIFGGAIGLLGKLAFTAFSPAQLIFIRLVVTLVFFAAIFLYCKKLRGVLAVILKNWRQFMLLVLTGVGGGMVLGFLGLGSATAVDYGLLFNISAVFMAAFAALILRETVRARDILLLGVALSGAALIVTKGEFSLGIFRNENFFGNIIIIFAAAGWGFYSIYGAHLGRANAQIDSAVVVFGSFLFGSLALLTYIVFFEPFRAKSFANLGAVSAASVLSIFATALLFYLWFEFINKKGGLLAGFVALSENISGAILPVLFLGEKLTAPIAIGGAIIIAALAIQDYFSRR